MGSPPIRTLILVEDRQAERDLRRALRTFDRQRGSLAVLTADALLAMRLRREGVDVRLPVDTLSRDSLIERDRLALSHLDVAFAGADTSESAREARREGRLLEYALIPVFMRVVCYLTAVDDQLRGSAIERFVLVGGGALPAAAELLARHRGIPTKTVGRSVWRRGLQALRRIAASRATRWVSTEFRSLVLEPAFLALLFASGLWRRLAAGEPRLVGSGALIISGDRFTQAVIDRLRDRSFAVVIAGATQPGRALLAKRDLMTLESFTTATDGFRFARATVRVARRTFAQLRDPEHHARLVAAGVPYWPLVARAVGMHAVVWLPLLRHLETLIGRIVRASPRTQLVVPDDVTPYSRTAVRAARRLGVHAVGIQHGLLGEPNGQSLVQIETEAIWGPATADFFQEPKPRFVVTGNPRFDALATRPARDRPRDHAFTVVICTGFVQMISVCATDYDNLLIIDAALAWAKSRPGVRIVHKLHPGEELKNYEAAARALEWDRGMLTRINAPILYDLIEDADVLIAGYSTTIIEAIALGTPAIVFDALVQRHNLPLELVPGVTVAESIAELHRQLDAVHDGPAVDRDALKSSPELREYISVLDGRAAERVANLIGDWYQIAAGRAASLG